MTTITRDEIKDIVLHARERAGLESDVPKATADKIVSRLAAALEAGGVTIKEFPAGNPKARRFVFLDDESMRSSDTPEATREKNSEAARRSRRAFVGSFTRNKIDLTVHEAIPYGELFGPNIGASLRDQVAVRVSPGKKIGVGRKISFEDAAQDYIERRTPRKGPDII